MVTKVVDVLRAPAPEVVNAQHFIAIVKKSVTEVAAKEAATASN